MYRAPFRTAVTIVMRGHVRGAAVIASDASSNRSVFGCKFLNLDVRGPS
jgi:hypothetical protein